MANALPVCCGIIVAIIVVWLFFGMQTLEPSDYGLEYDWWSATVNDNNGMAYTAGRYFLGVTKRFITFPAMVETIQFENGYTSDAGFTMPAIWSRTSDGLAVELDCSMQYQLMPTNISKLYEQLGTFDQAQSLFAQTARSLIMTEATHYTAHQFFANRTTIQPLIEEELRLVFKDRLYAFLQFFQLQKIILPRQFEDAIRNTTLTLQEISISQAMRNRKAVEWETELLKMKQHVSVRLNQAKAQAAEIELVGQAVGQRTMLASQADAAAIRVKARATANATRIQRQADAASVLAARRAEAATVRLKSLTYFNATNISYYLQALSYQTMMQAVGSEARFLELMKVQALQNVSWKGMTVSVPKGSDPLAFMGLASAA